MTVLPQKCCIPPGPRYIGTPISPENALCGRDPGGMTEAESCPWRRWDARFPDPPDLCSYSSGLRGNTVLTSRASAPEKFRAAPWRFVTSITIRACMMDGGQSTRVDRSPRMGISARRQAVSGPEAHFRHPSSGPGTRYPGQVNRHKGGLACPGLVPRYGRNGGLPVYEGANGGLPASGHG